jgi:SAM-dependent methyltransferase
MAQSLSNGEGSGAAIQPERHLLRRVRDSVQERGILETFSRAARRGVWSLQRLSDHRAQTRFDKAHSIESRGTLTGCGPGKNVYQPVRIATFERAMRLFPPNPAGLTFVDVGCGKGAAMVLAAKHGFAKLVGVEYEPELAALGAQNLRRSPTVMRSGCDAGVVCADARQFALPEEPFVVFFFNSFDGALLSEFIEHLEASLRERQREAWVLYVNPAESERFDRRPMFHRVAAYTEESAPGRRPGDYFVIYRAGATA